MKGADIFPSKYIKADDLKGREVAVTISHVAMEQLGTDQKLILYFQRAEKGMVCNKTNFGRIAYLYGDETDDWADKPVILAAEFVEFQGKTVKGLRVRPPASHIPPPQMPVRESENPADGMSRRDRITSGPFPAEPAPLKHGSMKDQIDDEIPF